jgi:hypothetical protein
MKMTFALASLGVALLISGLRANVSSLDAAAIRDAMELGRMGKPTPYGLHFLNPKPTGFVYTPFLRIAMASRAAREGGRELSAESLPSSLAGSAVVVALEMTWRTESNCKPSDFDRFMSIPHVACLAPSRIACAVDPDPRQQPRAVIRPLWVSTDINRLTDFGAARPSPLPLVIAAFPAESFKPGYTLYASSGKISSDCSGFSGAGAIPSEDLPHWR